MKQPINLVLIVILAYFCSLTYGAKKYLYKSEENNEYFIETAQKFTQVEALMECKMRDMDILTIESAKKAEEIEKLLTKVFSKKPIPNIYLGANDLEEYRKFNWITNLGSEPFTYTNWEDSEPNDYKGLNERCVQVGYHGTLKWNDINCERNYGYICQKKEDFNDVINDIVRA